MITDRNVAFSSVFLHFERLGIDLLNYMDTGVKFYVHPRGILPILSSAGSAVAPGL
jgi:hypothetical protein